jgi:glutathione synthase/RimK-type ligase-like ATP-grasp enzyme
MPRNRLLIRTIIDFRRLYHRLGPGDAVIGTLSLRPGEEFKLLDLMDRGVACFPAPLAQLLGRSKVAQAEVLGEVMVPGTFVAYSQADLAAHLADFHSRGGGAVVTKRDRAHLGLGVSLWPSLEACYSLGGLQVLPYPLVVQPFLAEARDLRVVVLGDYAEGYERVNPHSFRKNLFQGGSSRPAALSEDQLRFCRQVMARGKFAYAILDVLITPQEELYLTEISLKGGLTGARLNQQEFKQRVAGLEEDFRQEWENS